MVLDIIVRSQTLASATNNHLVDKIALQPQVTSTPKSLLVSPLGILPPANTVQVSIGVSSIQFSTRPEA